MVRNRKKGKGLIHKEKKKARDWPVQLTNWGRGQRNEKKEQAPEEKRRSTDERKNYEEQGTLALTLPPCVA